MKNDRLGKDAWVVIRLCYRTLIDAGQMPHKDLPQQAVCT